MCHAIKFYEGEHIQLTVHTYLNMLPAVINGFLHMHMYLVDWIFFHVYT